MRKIVDSIFQHPAARVLILIVLVIRLSVYIGSSSVRRGFLHGSFCSGVGCSRLRRAVDLELEVVLAHGE